MKSKVMTKAWQIFKLGFASTFSQALMKAWLLVKAGSGRPTKITFAKVETGEIRETTTVQLGADTLDKGYISFVEIVEGVGQWRRLRVENIITQ
jgi:hypothetical protein